MRAVRVKNTEEKIWPTKIICLARTYRKHAEEMKSELPTEPVLFLKPPSALIHSGEKIVIPEASSNVHHEGELSVVMGKKGRNISKEKAYDHVRGYAAFLDITARDIQSKAKEKRHPWSVSKGFDTFAPISDIVPKEEVEDPHTLDIELRLNGQIKQQSSTSYMIFTVDEIIAYISKIMTLERGDIIATGTPEGVGRITRGDTVTLEIEQVGRLENKVV
ncbi:MAG: fumarylacetoacetate hydrolase family protein [Euryarchaeota archaeon]|nr:fumarylacetoacetate hydrolase family protein [Euryarchaeota archaeon]